MRDGGGWLYCAWLRARSLKAAVSLRIWQRRLGLNDFRGSLQPTHPLQITNENGEPGEHMVGVVVYGREFRLLHTRPLREDDVVHELLHVLCPDWEHEEVEAWTDHLVSEPRLAALLTAGFGWQVAPYGFLHKFFGRRLARWVEPVVSGDGEPSGPDVMAFNLRTKRTCTIRGPQMVTLKNGRKAIRGVASDDGVTTVIRILGAGVHR
jgi:hypothetical protein